MAKQTDGAANPFRGVYDAVSEMNRMSDRFTDGAASVEQPRGHSDAWSPVTDIFAEDSALLIRCEIPGVATNDVEVSLSRGMLAITGERHTGGRKADQFYVQERQYGQFRRDITLPEGVKEDDISADFGEGVLLVTVRGAAGSSGPAQISVNERSN